MKKDRTFEKLKAELPGIKKDVLLKNYTTYKIGGPAKYFLACKSKEDLSHAIIVSNKLKLPVFVLGGGSNLLVSDKGFRGLVIKISTVKKELSGNIIYTEAGVMLSNLTGFCLEHNLTGLEWSAGIPGTVGGAIYGNAQAFGTKISECIRQVEVFDIKKQKLKTVTKKGCKFSLKNSLFKKNKNLIIISAILEFKEGDRKLIKDKVKEFLDYRKAGHPINFPSAGSVFVNPERKITNKKLLKDYPEFIKMNERGVIPSGFLIEKCGLKGKIIGKAQISEKHANFIINLGGAKASDVLRLMKMAKERVYKKFKIKLETEIQYLK